MCPGAAKRDVGHQNGGAVALLEAEKLTKRFRSPRGEGRLVVDVPELALDRGDQVALHGGSGSGKTTFLNLIAGILRPDTGSVRFEDTERTGLSEGRLDRFRADHFVYVFQTFHLLQGYTALENVLLGMQFGPGPDRSRARELLERVGLSDRTHDRPAQLSVGQQQRVAVARAVANRPRLVLADEPTGNLDPRSARDSLELIREVCRENESALLLVSHDRSVLDRFEDVRDFADINRALLPSEGAA